MKARFDYLKPGLVIDLKTFSNDGRDLWQLIASHIQRYKYHLQLAVYEQAHKVCLGKEAEMALIFQQTGPINNTIVKPFPRDLVAFEQGRELMRLGMSKFATLYNRYGDKPWYDDIVIQPIQDEDFSFAMFE